MVMEVDATPKTRRWTRLEYERLVELGVFLDGLLALREPQGSRHSAAIRALDDDSEPEPDVAVVPRDPERYRP